MSLLQTALHALPSGSLVTKDLAQSNKQLNELLDAKREGEVLVAKQIQAATGRSWSEAVLEAGGHHG